MIKKMINRISSLTNRHLVLLFIFAVLESCNLCHDMVQEKMQGLWVIDEDKSKIERSQKLDMGNTFVIDKQNIRLPGVFLGKLIIDSLMSEEEIIDLEIKRNKKMDNDREGTFYFPDSNADSIVIEAVNNPLIGRYKIQIFQEGSYRFMILSNDSTYLYCTQNTFPFLM